MCNANCIIFGVKNLSADEVKDKKVIEVGSLDVNGSLRSVVELWEPAKYIGVDIAEGSGVDMLCSAEDLIDGFGKESFDIVVCTELLEHVRDWRKVISNLKNICKLNGIILTTTRSLGFAYHSHPYDFWRYEVDDMRQIFSDCEILALQKDPQDPGVFIKVKKLNSFSEKNLSGYKLYSIVANKRIIDVTDRDFKSFRFLVLTVKEKIKQVARNLLS